MALARRGSRAISLKLAANGETRWAGFGRRTEVRWRGVIRPSVCLIALYLVSRKLASSITAGRAVVVNADIGPPPASE